MVLPLSAHEDHRHHDLDLVMDVCGRTIAISGGRVAADGPTGTIFRNEALLHVNHLEKPLRMQGGRWRRQFAALRLVAP